MQTLFFSIIAFNLIFVECKLLKVECDFLGGMRTFKCRIQQKLSIKLILCIKSKAQSVFDIVRPFDILGVECDVKRFHIAFATPKTPIYLPKPETFSLVKFCTILSYLTFRQICRIWSNCHNHLPLVINSYNHPNQHP